MSSEEEHSDDDEPLYLGNEAIEALQSVMGFDIDRSSLNSFIDIETRGWLQEEQDEDEQDIDRSNVDDNDTILPGESHADYYKRLYPERYLNSNTAQQTSGEAITNPVR